MIGTRKINDILTRGDYSFKLNKEFNKILVG